MRQLVFPDRPEPVRWTINSDTPLTDDEYFELCAVNPDVRFERTPKGGIVIVPPAGFESDYRNTELVGQLVAWTHITRRGKVFGPSAEFFLPTGAALSPDASFLSNARLQQIAKNELRKFPHIAPEFVVEVMSPSDSLTAAKKKMEDWRSGGVELGWLIDGDRQTVYIYRQGESGFEKLAGIASIRGEGAIEGFELDLTPIWAGL